MGEACPRKAWARSPPAFRPGGDPRAPVWGLRPPRPLPVTVLPRLPASARCCRGAPSLHPLPVAAFPHLPACARLPAWGSDAGHAEASRFGAVRHHMLGRPSGPLFGDPQVGFMWDATCPWIWPRNVRHLSLARLIFPVARLARRVAAGVFRPA